MKKEDPFGNLMDWGRVLDVLDELAEKGQLAECQRGLIRMLRYKGNWRLREAALKRAEEIQTPSDELAHHVLAILDDDNIYYDARILAGETLTQFLKNLRGDSRSRIDNEVRATVEKLKRTPQPPFFDKALERLYSEAHLQGV